MKLYLLLTIIFVFLKIIFVFLKIIFVCLEIIFVLERNYICYSQLYLRVSPAPQIQSPKKTHTKKKNKTLLTRPAIKTVDPNMGPLSGGHPTQDGWNGDKPAADNAEPVAAAADKNSETAAADKNSEAADKNSEAAAPDKNSDVTVNARPVH